MKIYTINTVQVINKSIEEVFAFFSDPENLAVITPENLCLLYTSDAADE